MLRPFYPAPGGHGLEVDVRNSDDLATTDGARRTVAVTLRVNGAERAVTIEPRRMLSDVLRDNLRLTGLHLGCEQGVCGACTVLLDGEPAVSCLCLAMEAQGRDIQTVEHLVRSPAMQKVTKAFLAHGAFQCGFCTPGFLMMAHDILNKGLGHDRDAVRAHLAGNICRCTGYEPIIDAIMAAAAEEVA
jgi:carbon-monoxide dehydrogenase small subunit